MTDANVTGKASKSLFMKYLRDKPHFGFVMNSVAQRGGDTSALLATMLQREQSKKCCSGYAFAGYEGTDDPAFFMRLIIGICVDRALSL